jgi:hypothetical protein
LVHRIWQKAFLNAFFNSLGVVHHKFVPVGHSEAFGWCHLVEETGKWCTLAHPPSSTAGYDEEPNLNHPSATVFSWSCAMWLLPLPVTQDIQQNTKAGRTATWNEDFQRCFSSGRNARVSVNMQGGLHHRCQN